MKKNIVQHYRTDTSGKAPEANELSYGEIAINYAEGSEGLFIKNSKDEVIKIEPTDLSNLVTDEEFQPYLSTITNSVQKGTLGKINNTSLEDGDITIDLSLYKIVKELPTENILDNKIYLVQNANSTESGNSFNEYLYDSEGEKWELFGTLQTKVDLTGYLTTSDAEKTYVKKSSNTNSSINTDDKGAMANFSDNGQAYLAVRPKTAKFLIDSPYVGAAFGVKDDGTAAFSHKTYTNYDKTTGNYTGAKNTAILQFSGPTGLRYAKNTGSANDVTEAMYKYVGVIDSPDDKQKVYSAAQVDALLSAYDEEIAKLKQAIIDLGGTIE